MAHIIGNSVDAEKLVKLIPMTKQGIDESLSKIEKYCQEMHNVWKNGHSGKIDELVTEIKKALKEAEDDFTAVGSEMKKYYDYLVSIGH